MCKYRKYIKLILFVIITTITLNSFTEATLAYSPGREKVRNIY